MTTGKRSGNKSRDELSGEKAGVKTRTATRSGNVTVTSVPKEHGRKVEQPETPVIPHEGAGDQKGTAARPFWSGSITIGLVNVPVRLHTMVRDKSVSFRLLHKEDGQPLRYDRVCIKEDRVIPWADTVRGYEVRKGEYLVFEPDELKAIMPESNRKIRIEKFVYYLSLDPVYFETPYILTPDRSEEAYNLLVTALKDLGRAAIGTITLRTKEYPVVVHVYGGGLVLTTLRYTDEVTSPHTFASLEELPVPKEAELALAKRIITDLSGDFSMADYHDRYREAVMALIEKKLAGEKVVYAEQPHPEEAKELMQALKETLSTLSIK